MKEIRTDIQALWGIAVLFVVLAHMELGHFRQGFLGVDIFFVISGYLITRIIIKDLQAQAFSFKEFYFKRAKRILPSVYSTIFLVILLAPWFLNSAELSALRSQVVGALT